MTSEDRALGRVEGKVDGLETRFAGLESRLADMAAVSSAEHAEVRGDLRRLGDQVGQVLDRHDKRLGALEETSAEGRGCAAAVKVGQGLAVLVLMALPFILDRGGV